VVSTYVNNLRLEEMATGEKSGTWGNITNTNLELVGQALGYGTRAIANASADNITIADGASDADRSMYLKLTGGGQACTVTLLPNTSSKMWIMENATSYTLTFTQGSGANVAVKAGQTKMIFADGLGSGAVVYELGTLSVKNIQADGTVTVGIDDTGYDVTFFGATTGKKLFWDESADTLNVAGTTALAGNLSVTGVTSNADGAVATPSITNTGDTNTGVYFPAADTVGVVAGGVEQFRFGSNPIPGGSKNVVINGSMKVSQRGTSFAAPADAAYLMDRFSWKNYVTTPVVTITQDTTSNIFTAYGFDTCMKIDVTTADGTVDGTNLTCLMYTMEGQDLQHWKHGSANSESLTLSFWFRSPKSGTHCVALHDLDHNMANIMEFEVASADTAEFISVTFVPKTSGTVIANDTTQGARIVWPMIAGSSYLDDSNVGGWSGNAGEKYISSNGQNLLDNVANNIYITGVQLEVGSIATDFAHEDYGTTLARCQRYLHYHTRASSVDHIFAVGKVNSTTVAEFVMLHPVTMRAAPTMSISAVDDFGIRHANTTTTTTNLVNLVSGPNAACVSATVSSGLTAGQGALLYQGSDGDFIQWSAEL
jgi:hypothetical protein